MRMRRRLRLLAAALVTCWSAAPDRWLQEYYVRGTRVCAAWTCSRSLLLWRFRSFSFLGKPHYFWGKQPSWWCSWGCATSARQPKSFILDASTTSVFFALLTARARCLVQTAHGTRFWADYVASTWHRRGNCRSQNVVQLQASTRLKTVSHESAHRLTPKRPLDTLRTNCTKSYSQEDTSLFPGGGFLGMADVLDQPLVPTCHISPVVVDNLFLFLAFLLAMLIALPFSQSLIAPTY